MTQWLETLRHKGATLNETATRITQVPASTSGTRIVPLVHQTLVQVKGPDAEKFLQGQLSCDLADVNSIGSRLGAHCNIKGHMLSLMRVIKAADETYWLRLHNEISDKALANLKKYIIFSKAEAEQLDDYVGLGFSGPGAASLATKLFERIPSEDDGCYRSEEMVLVRIPGDRYELWLPQSKAGDVLNTLLEIAPLDTTASWELDGIRAGLPDLRTETSEAFIPQMTNLQVFKGVSFTKGCYTGQEIVTRLQHRGQLKRPMYRAQVSTSERPQAGAAVHCADKENVGTVVLSAPAGDGIYELLVVAVKDRAEQDTLLLESTSGPALELLELPYVLDPELFESKR